MVNFHCHTNSCSHRSSPHRHETQRVLRCAIPYRELTPDRQYCSSGKQKGLMTCPFYTPKLGILQGRGRAELHSDWSGEDPAPVSGSGRTLGHPRWGRGRRVPDSFQASEAHDTHHLHSCPQVDAPNSFTPHPRTFVPEDEEARDRQKGLLSPTFQKALR